MGSEQTFHELRALGPEVPVILSSGHAEQDATQRFTGKGVAGFIQKPYRLDTLVAVLQRGRLWRGPFLTRSPNTSPSRYWEVSLRRPPATRSGEISRL
jgi:CheY-like chemotaxis protein